MPECSRLFRLNKEWEPETCLLLRHSHFGSLIASTNYASMPNARAIATNRKMGHIIVQIYTIGISEDCIISVRHRRPGYTQQLRGDPLAPRYNDGKMLPRGTGRASAKCVLKRILRISLSPLVAKWKIKYITLERSRARTIRAYGSAEALTYARTKFNPALYRNLTSPPE